MIGRAPDCMRCTHLHRDPDATRNTCDAFPQGIPAPIFDGERRHLKPYPGDKGVRFEPVDPGALAATR